MLHCVHNNGGGSLGGAACKGHLTVWSFVHRSLSALQPGQGLTESQESQLTTALSLEIRNILKRFKTWIISRWKWTLLVRYGLIETTEGLKSNFCWWKVQPVEKSSWEIFSKGSGGQGAVRRSFLLSFNFSSHLTSPRTLSSLKKSALPFLFLRHIFSTRGVQASTVQLLWNWLDLYWSWSNMRMKTKVTGFHNMKYISLYLCPKPLFSRNIPSNKYFLKQKNERGLGCQHEQHQTRCIPKENKTRGKLFRSL